MLSRELAFTTHRARKTGPVMRAPLPVLNGECRWLGERVNKGCGSLVFKCTKYQTTTTRLTKCDTAARHCATCSDRYSYDDMLLIESKRIELANYSATDGDGVIYVGGGKYWPMIVAGIKMLRASGSTLPVEVWYRASEEPVHPSDVEGLNVRLYDSNAYAFAHNLPPVPAGRNGGWANKLFALYYTRFARVLFLDADAYCIANPAPLFALLDTGAPFAYWRDLASQNNSIKWKHVYPQGEKANVPPVQGGQLLIDRTRAGTLINTAKYMCDNADYYFKHMYGDQDTWRVALALKCSDFRMIDLAHWSHGVAFFCGLDRSNPAIVHRCQAKLFEPQHIPAGKVKYTNPQYGIPREAELFGYFAEVVNKRPIPDTDIFDVIYSRQLWGGGSGAGSSAREARPVVDVVNDLIRSKGYTKLIDAGCGDGFVGNLYQCAEYIGYDVSTHAVGICRKKFPRKNYSMLDIGLEYDKLEYGDILVCKDVLHHQPNEWVRRFVRGLIESKRHKCLVFVFDSRGAIAGADCHTGGYRAIAPDSAVFNGVAWDATHSVMHKTVAIKFLDGRE